MITTAQGLATITHNWERIGDIVFNAFESINVTVSDKCYIFEYFSFYLHLVTGLKWHV